jgi:hypothetical protein
VPLQQVVPALRSLPLRVEYRLRLNTAKPNNNPGPDPGPAAAESDGPGGKNRGASWFKRGRDRSDRGPAQGSARGSAPTERKVRAAAADMLTLSFTHPVQHRV